MQELPLLWSRELDHYLLKIGEFMAEPLESKTTPEVWRFVLTVYEHGAQYFQPNIAISITHATLHHLLHRLLGMVAGGEADRLFEGLMAYCETKTGVINRELFELAQLIRAEPTLERALAGAASRDVLAGGTLAAFPKVAERFQRFIRDHGHREVDFDMYHPTWVEAPWVVLDNLRLILQTPMAETPAAKERELHLSAQQAELELFRRSPSALHFFFREILRLARIYTSLDDLEHYQTTRLALPMRRGLRELGERLVRRDVLADPMDIFLRARRNSTRLSPPTPTRNGASCPPPCGSKRPPTSPTARARQSGC